MFGFDIPDIIYAAIFVLIAGSMTYDVFRKKNYGDYFHDYRPKRTKMINAPKG